MRVSCDICDWRRCCLFRRFLRLRSTQCIAMATWCGWRMRSRRLPSPLCRRVGNSAFRMKVKGKDVLRFPYTSVEEYLKGAARHERHSVPRALGQPARRDGVLRERQKVSVQHGARQRAARAEQSPDPRVPDERVAMADCRGEVRPQVGVGDKPARVLPAAAMDGAVSVRPHQSR